MFENFKTYCCLHNTFKTAEQSVFSSQNKILNVPIGLGIVFWFSQVFGLILMLLKNLSNLFKAFDQFGEMDFFSSQVYQFVFIYFYIILSIKRERMPWSYIIFGLFNLHCFTGHFFFFFFKCKSYISFSTLLCNVGKPWSKRF